MLTRLLSLSLSVIVLLATSCQQNPKSKDYNGYMTRPYTIKGKRYVPMSVEQALCYSEEGLASHYDESWFFGMVSGNTSIGEDVHPWHLHAAHPYLPLPCKVRVTSLRNGKSVIVRVNDRGPFINGRIIDLSQKAAEKLDCVERGIEPVRVEVLSVGDGKWERVSPVHSS